MASQYDPRTGITTFRDPAAAADEATVVAPSTATGFTAAPGMLSSQPQPSIFDPVNPQVRPRDDFFGFQYNYSPEELAQLGYQYVPESTTSRFVRRNDDRERIEETIPGHYIDPTRFAPLRRPGDDSDLPDWMFSQRVRNGDDFDIVRNPLVVDPFRPITPGHLDELRQYGLWQNLSDPNAPLYAPLRAKGITPTPYQMASMLLGQSGLGLTSTPEQWQAALGNMQISPELATAIRQRLQDIAQNKAENSGGLFGSGGFLGTGISTGNPTLDSALSFGQGAVMGGNIGGTVATGNFDSAALGDAALQDAVSLGSAALGPTISGLTDGGMFGTVAGGAAGGGLNALLHGENSEDVLQGALTGAATAGGTRLGGQVLAHFFPAETPVVPSTQTRLAAAPSPVEPLKRQGMLPFFEPIGSQVPGMPADFATGAPVTMSGEALGSAVPPPAPLLAQAADTGAMTDIGGLNALLSPRASQVPGMPVDLATGAPIAAGDLSGVQTGSAVPVQFDGTLESLLSAAGLGPSVLSPLDQPPPKAPQATPQEQRAQEMAKSVERLAKFGKALAQLHEGRGEPEDAPRRADGQSDADYADSLVEYAGFDPAALAEQGLTPGTPEYFEYAQAQLQAQVDRITAGLDDNGDLAQQLARLPREELDRLERSLFVLGQMGTLVGSGRFANPFTGEAEEIITNGRRVQPSRAAFEQGLVRSAHDLAGLAPEEGRQRLRDMVGQRDRDLFGMQARADARTLAEQFAAQSFYSFDDDLKRRRYEMAVSPEAWREILDQMSPEQLRALLASLGGDEDRGIAALSQLVG